MQEFNEELGQYFTPRVDVFRSQKAGRIIHKKVEGPKRDENQELQRRSMIGDEVVYNEAI